MGFRRSRPQLPPEEDPVPWREVTRFVVGRRVRGDESRIVRPAYGPPAVRVPNGGENRFAPAVFIEQPHTAEELYDLYGAQDRAPVCRVLPLAGTGTDTADRGDVDGHRVVDPAGAEIGRVFRTPRAKRSVQQTLWFQQPGHPNVVARHHWATGSTREVAGRVTTAAVGTAAVVAAGLALSAIGLDGDGDREGIGDSGRSPSKPVTWRAGDEDVLDYLPGQGRQRPYVPRADWLDLRLAFALAVLRESW
ncbi:hypothetical protein [Streptomyces sp. NBC_00448]|uniref:hypothetical protein n=1 Tax=Streptomyces sp. NBC_00448 TaxID=2903652 RepID=UPI002E1EA4D9